jgi:hypothetical protein
MLAFRPHERTLFRDKLQVGIISKGAHDWVSDAGECLGVIISVQLRKPSTRKPVQIAAISFVMLAFI